MEISVSFDPSVPDFALTLSGLASGDSAPGVDGMYLGHWSSCCNLMPSDAKIWQAAIPKPIFWNGIGVLSFTNDHADTQQPLGLLAAKVARRSPRQIEMPKPSQHELQPSRGGASGGGNLVRRGVMRGWLAVCWPGRQCLVNGKGSCALGYFAGQSDATQP